MTTANKITILRILLIPLFVVEVLYYVQTGNEIHRLVAVLSFAVAAILDGVDGYIARRYNQWSELGTVLDPLADKLLLVSGIVVLSFDHAPRLGQIPLWLTGIIIGRDLLLGIGAIVVRLTVGTITVRPRLMGKVATVLQMAVILWILLEWDELSQRLAEMDQPRCRHLHRPVRPALRLGRHAPVEFASVQFSDAKIKYGQGSPIEIQGRRRRAEIYRGDQRRRENLARRLQGQKCHPVFLSQGRHARLHEGSLRVSAIILPISRKRARSFSASAPTR